VRTGAAALPDSLSERHRLSRLVARAATRFGSRGSLFTLTTPSAIFYREEIERRRRWPAAYVARVLVEDGRVTRTVELVIGRLEAVRAPGARRFYERGGWRPDATKVDRRGDVKLHG
jgi:hypothetical protein